MKIRFNKKDCFIGSLFFETKLTTMKKGIFFLSTVVLAISLQSFNQQQAAVNMQNGKAVYETYCMSCHQENGNGIEGAFPSLVKTGNLADKNRLVQIIIKGMRGPVLSKGVQYNGEMAGVDLTDKEVADLVNYIRNTWGNKAPLIKATDVVLAKKAVVKGHQPY